MSEPELAMLEVRYVTERRLPGDRGAKLLRYLLARGADEFSITVMALRDTPAPFADAFEDELGPYERRPARRRVIGDARGDDLERLVRLWTFNEQSLERLLSFLDDGVFRWPAGPDGWLEDLTVYRRGELVLGLVSHEREGVLRLTANELAELAALGVPFETSAESIKY
jgi:hypothetical protein